MASEADWSSLPMFILYEILDKLVEIGDRISFSMVCKFWNSTYSSSYKKIYPSLPMLLVPTRRRPALLRWFKPWKTQTPWKAQSGKQRNLYNLITGKFENRIKLEIPNRKRLCGSCYGWLATIEKVKQGLVIILVNPYRKNYPKIQLPPLEFEICHIDYRYDIKRFILTADPGLCPDNYIVVVSYSTFGKLAIFIADQNSWTYFKRRTVPPFEIFSDAIVYRGSVLVVGLWNDIVYFEIEGQESKWPPIIKVAAHRLLASNCQRSYLVETSRGELLLINRYRDYGSGETTSFEVFKLTLHETTREVVEQVEMRSLDGDALFIGDNYSTAIPASRISGCLESNSIYFTDDYGHKNGPHDIGVFHLEDQSFGTHYMFNPESEKLLPPAIFTVPPC